MSYKFNISTWYKNLDENLLPEGFDKESTPEEYFALLRVADDVCVFTGKSLTEACKIKPEGYYTSPEVFEELFGVVQAQGAVVNVVEGAIPEYFHNILSLTEKVFCVIALKDDGTYVKTMVDNPRSKGYTKVKGTYIKSTLLLEHDGYPIVNHPKYLAKEGLLRHGKRLFSTNLNGYHSMERTFRIQGDNPKYRIGFEIEKEDPAARSVLSSELIRHQCNWVAESDSSLGEGGYELVSPIYNMLSRAQLKKDAKLLSQFINASATESSGGHINLSVKGETGYELLKSIKGFVPLLYAMYPQRVDNSYSRAYKFNSYLDSPSKKAFRPARDRLEIRIFPAVVDCKDLMQRYELCRYMVLQSTANPETVINRLLDPTTKLHQITTEMGYKPLELAQKMLDMDANIDGTRYASNIHISLKEKGLTIKTQVKLQTKDINTITKDIMSQLKAKGVTDNGARIQEILIESYG